MTRLSRQLVLYKLPFLFLWVSTGISQERFINKEFRALWVVRHSITTPEKIDELVDIAVDCGFNTLIVQVRGRGDAYYKSKFVPKAENLTEPYFDPLAYILKQAKQKGIDVHAWLNVYLLWSSTHKPLSKKHLYHQQPNWSMVGVDGKRLIDKTQMTLRQQNLEGIYIEPGLIVVQKHFVRIIDELISNYKVDGIHLDYIRYPDNDTGYHPYIRSHFMVRYFFDPIDIQKRGEILIDWLGWQGFKDLKFTWDNFRRENITQLVKQVRGVVDKTDKKVFLSAAVIADIEKAEKVYLQDWGKWLKNEWIDFVIPMNYTPDLEEFVSRVGKIQEKFGMQNIYLGISAYNQNRYKLVSKIYKSRALGAQGFAVFSYDTLRENDQFQRALRKAINDK